MTISTKDITDAVKNSVEFNGNSFALCVTDVDKISSYFEKSELEILLVKFVETIDLHWPFDIEPNERATGSLIEILRGCRFINADGIRIVPDVNESRLLGAYYTPEIIVRYLTESATRPFCGKGVIPRILDPACGAGYFLLEAISVLARNFPDTNPVEFLRTHIRGIDIDPVAVALSRRNISWFFKKNFGLSPDKKLLESAVINESALSDLEFIRSLFGKFDSVIGNPPYQNLSGRGSPVARLRKSGRLDEADALASEISLMKSRFSRSSKGCIDRYKWFIERGIQFLSTSGMLGFITPNTWIQYPRFRDIRTIFNAEGSIIELIDFGSIAFDRAHVPASTIVFQKTNKNSSGFKYVKLEKSDHDALLRDGSDFLYEKLRNGKLARLNESGSFMSSAGDIRDSEFERILRNAQSGEMPYLVRLVDVAVLREGSHAIPAIQKDISRMESSRFSLPVLIDKTMDRLKIPEMGYVKNPGISDRQKLHHTGYRFLVRKTGDRIVAAPSPVTSFALSHQNVYVGKVRDNAISMKALVGILSSRLLTEIYRDSPFGQKGRIHAQLRIIFLNSLPVVIIPAEHRSEFPVKTGVLSDIDKIEPVTLSRCSSGKEYNENIRKAAMLHSIIESAVDKIIKSNDHDLFSYLDHAVELLYGISWKNEKE